MIVTVSAVAGAAAAATGSAAEYRVVCPDEGAGLDIVDVLEATGEHGTFVGLLHRFDPEGLAIRTRTGVLTGSDQRTRTTFEGGALRIEGIRIGSTAWCTEAGSVLSLDAVITDVAMPSTLTWTWNRLVRILLYQDIRFVIYATVGAVSIGMVVSRVVTRRSRRTEDGAAHVDGR